MKLPRPFDDPPAWGQRRFGKASVLCSVVALHLLLLLAWRLATLRPPSMTQAEAPSPALVWLQLAPPKPRAEPAKPVEEASAQGAARLPSAALQPTLQPARAPSREPQAASPPSASTAPTAPTLAATEPMPPASAPLAVPPSLLNTEATRQAIRMTGRQALLSERAADATGLPQQRTDTQLVTAVEQAGKGDCLKGEFFGGGGGLLSLPFAALAVARGQCAK